MKITMASLLPAKKMSLHIAPDKIDRVLSLLRQSADHLKTNYNLKFPAQ